MYFFILAIILACSKDIDILMGTLSDDPVGIVEEIESAATESQEGTAAEDMPEDGYESRITEFPPSHDAHIQSGRGYNQQIIRMAKNSRISYLMFDLSAIDSIGAYITEAILQFTVSGDEGNGTIEVFKGIGYDWTETTLGETTAPETDVIVGSIIKEYKIGVTELVELSTLEMQPETTSLILEQKEGDDLAIASKEHPSKKGPKLIVRYNAPVGAKEIMPPGQSTSSEDTNEETTTEEPPAEEDASTPANIAPVAIADATPTSGGVPMEVTFTGGNSTDDTAVTSYTWDFKDGNTSTEDNPVHMFTTVGSYEVTLTVTDAQGLTNTDTVTITASDQGNEAPEALASANPLTGTAPLTVQFLGSGSSDDSAVTSYIWNITDNVNANVPDPKYTFENSGVYDVSLTVSDEQGLSDTSTVTITVNEPQTENAAPIAVATATPLTGDAPLTVNFTGSNSVDDNGIVSYYWDFTGDPSSAPNASRTFNDPGVYDVTLTVTDGGGLQDTTTLTITVTQPSGGNTGGSDCITNGGNAGDTGLKTWCWEDIYFPSYTGSTGISFSDGQLSYNTECDAQSVTKDGGRIKFNLNPTTPSDPGSWCSRQFNMRAEISTRPWPINHSMGTEEWFGFNYTFGDDYKPDVNEWLFHQVHNGIVGQTPLYELMVARAGLYGAQAGEIVVKNNANSPDHVLTGVIPQAGQTIKVVIHVIWDNATNGLLQVWIDDNKVYDKQVTTIRPGWNFGGNAKWGIYKWPWVDEQNVQSSANAGVSSLTTYMGNLRIVTRKPGDIKYGMDAYTEVSPQ
ncbi:MAG: PKD domain-containing protein [Flavobacteriaceae bacterium]|nr:PKD domain-containing protein [Flavobacteriaceae bacterium]